MAVRAGSGRCLDSLTDIRYASCLGGFSGTRAGDILF